MQEKKKSPVRTLDQVGPGTKDKAFLINGYREMGWATGLEPAATGATTLCSTT